MITNDTPALDLDDDNTLSNAGGTSNASEPEVSSDDELELEEAEDRLSGGEIHSDVANFSIGGGSVDLLGQEQLDTRYRDDANSEGSGHDNDDSEVSFSSEQEVDEEKEAACEYTAEKLFEQLQGGHYGCSEEQHDEKLREHMAGEGNNHYGLGEIINNSALPIGTRLGRANHSGTTRAISNADRCEVGGDVLRHPSSRKLALSYERVPTQRADTGN